MVFRDRLTLILFCLVPFVVIVGGIIHEGQRASMSLAGVAIIGAFIKNNWIRAFIWYWLVWIIFMLLMTQLGKLPPPFSQKAFYMTSYMISAFVFFLAMQESMIKIEYVYNVICFTAIIQALLAICQMWALDPFFDMMKTYANVKKLLDVTETTGSLGNNNFLAFYLMVSMPFFFRRYWCLFIPVLFAVVLSSITSTAIVAGMTGAAYYFRKKVKWRWMALVALPLIGWLLFSKASLTWNFTWDHDRFHWWRSAIMLWKESGPGGWILGFGPTMSWGRNFPIHNEWLTALFNFGIVGVVLIIGYIVTAYRKNRILNTAIIIASITFISSYPMHLAPTVTLIMIILGLMEREKHGDRHINRDRAIHWKNSVTAKIQNSLETQAKA